MIALSKFWDQIWPFEHDLISFFGSRIPTAVLEAFPPLGPRPKEMSELYAQVMAESRKIADGQNPKFERVAATLARFGIPRADLIRRTGPAHVLFLAYQWAMAKSDEVEAMRSRVNELGGRLRAVRKALAATPTFTPAALAELDLVLRYLRGIPTQGELRTWRRKIGLNRRTGGLWELKAGTSIARALVQYLRTEQTRATEQERVTDARLERRQFPERYAHALLHARYPDYVDADWRKLSNRVNRK
jgi:hypothetical protein